ncbi:unnamed protein product [Absidia cylindrospora]
MSFYPITLSITLSHPNPIPVSQLPSLFLTNSKSSAHNLSLNDTHESLQDFRILSLYFILPLSLDTQSSVSRYMGDTKHELLSSELLPVTNNMAISPSNNVLSWANSLTYDCRDWTTTTKKCIIILNEANSSEEPLDLLAASILFNCAPRLAKRMIGDPSKDTFVHFYLDGILDDVFSSKPRLQQEWANGWLSSSKLERNKAFKPDWVVYVKLWWQRCDWYLRSETCQQSLSSCQFLTL